MFSENPKKTQWGKLFIGGITTMLIIMGKSTKKPARAAKTGQKLRIISGHYLPWALAITAC
jgi:hypothetical protein